MQAGHGRRNHGPVQKSKDFKGTIKKLLAYIAPERIALVVVLIFAILSVCFNVVGPRILGNATTELFNGIVAKVTGTGGIDFGRIGYILTCLMCLYLSSSLFAFVQGWVMTGVTQRICYRMRREVIEKINRMPVSYFETTSTGDVMSRITNDVDTVGQSLNQCVSQVITSITQLIGVTVMMLQVSVVLSGITFFVIPASFLIVMLVVRRSQRYFVRQQQLLGAVNGLIEESFTGQTVIQVFNREDKAIEDFEQANKRLFNTGWRAQFYSGVMMPLMTFISNLSFVCVVVVGARLAINGTITPGDIQAFMQYVRNFTQPINQLSNVSNMVQMLAAATERVFEFLDEKEEDASIEHDEQMCHAAGKVDFEHVNFGYVTDKTIINDFTCHVEPGQTVAIVGPTGAGKTTLMKLLMRFYDVNAGSITIDGVDIREMNRDDLRSNFSMVLQDTWLFNGSIKDNIAYGKQDATDEEIEASARAAYADHFIHTLPGGYDFELNEEASNVSQGQKQLLTIARAILANRPILILDEATSNVDTRTEQRIQQAMDNLKAGRTSFVIAHRLSTIRNADLILVLRDGDIVESGTHTELLAQNGFYAELYNSQFEE